MIIAGARRGQFLCVISDPVDRLNVDNRTAEEVACCLLIETKSYLIINGRLMMTSISNGFWINTPLFVDRMGRAASVCDSTCRNKIKQIAWIINLLDLYYMRTNETTVRFHNLRSLSMLNYDNLYA